MLPGFRSAVGHRTCLKAVQKYGLLLLVLGSTATLLNHFSHCNRFQHFAVHQPGKVYRSAWLETDALVELIERHRIRTVLNLCHPGEMGNERWAAERRTVAGAGARLLELPIAAKTTGDFETAKIQAHLYALDDPNNYPLLVHCQHGVTRTAKVLMIYDVVHRGVSAKESLSRMPLFGRSEPNVHVREFARQLDENRRILSAADGRAPNVFSSASKY